MNITLTKHFKLRLQQRANLEQEVMELVPIIIKKINKWKLRPYRKTVYSHSTVFSTHYKGINLVYQKKQWAYKLITFYQRQNFRNT